MAITQAFPGLEVEVHTNAGALREYVDDDEQDSHSTVTKYIEAQSGVEFGINYNFTSRPEHGVVLYVYIDGNYITGVVIFLHDFKSGQTHKNKIEGKYHKKDGHWFRQKFSFASLRIGDSQTRPVGGQLIKDLEELGQITVEAYRIKEAWPTTYKHSQARDFKPGEVPEKALKGRALSHHSTLGAPIEALPIKSYRTKLLNEKPVATYIFKYRSKAALQSLLVLPRSPSPIPLEDRDVESLSVEEMRELLRRQRERETSRPIKQEHGVKRERSETFDGDATEDEVSFVSAKKVRGPVTLNEDGVELVDLT